MNGRLSPPPRSEWAPAARGRGEVQEHRCGKCFGPFGKSAIPCPNEPSPEAKQAIREVLADAAALKDQEGTQP